MDLLTAPAARSAFPRFTRDDRRECPRLPLDRIELSFGGRVFQGFGDVSVGGAFWLGEAPGVLGRVELDFHLPGETLPLRVSAEVLASRVEGTDRALHLRFVELPFEAELRLARYVDECLLLSGLH